MLDVGLNMQNWDLPEDKVGRARFFQRDNGGDANLTRRKVGGSKIQYPKCQVQRRHCLQNIIRQRASYNMWGGTTSGQWTSYNKRASQRNKHQKQQLQN